MQHDHPAVIEAKIRLGDASNWLPANPMGIWHYYDAASKEEFLARETSRIKKAEQANELKVGWSSIVQDEENTDYSVCGLRLMSQWAGGRKFCFTRLCKTCLRILRTRRAA